MSRLLHSFLLMAAFPLVGASVFAQGSFDSGFGGFGGFDQFDTGKDPVKLEAQFTQATEDRPAVLMVTATIDPGWHIYSVTQQDGGPRATTLKLAESDKYKPIGNWQSFPEPHSYFDRKIWGNVPVEEHDEQVTWYLPVELAEGVDPGSIEIKGDYELQACKQSCLELDGTFAAKLGGGVEIGPIEISKPTNVDSTDEVEVPEIPTPPENAGVYRADGSAVTWYAWLDRSKAKPGTRLRLFFRAELPDNWHINAYQPIFDRQGSPPTLIAPELNKAFTFYFPEQRTASTDPPKSSIDLGESKWHEDVAVWSVPFDALKKTAPGEYSISGLIGYQACEYKEETLGSCELQKGLRFSATVNIDSASSESEPASVTLSEAKYDEAAELAATIAPTLKPAGSNLKIIEFGEQSDENWGFLAILVGALLGGLILNLMPCVLPVIGLKLMSFAKQGGESQFRVFTLNLAYVAGLLSVFMLLATLAALPQLGFDVEGYDWGELNTETSFKVSMTVLVFVMALSFLGVWEIPIPGFAGSSKASEMAAREGYAGAFFKGVFTTILATPCSGPFLGPVFLFAFSQDVTTIYLVMLLVGLGMGSPYLVIGLYPSLIQWIPKPGAWMDTFKQGMAFLLLGTVVFLLSTLNEEFFIPTMSLLVACWFACWLGGRLPITASIFKKAGSWAVGIVIAAAVGYAGFALEREHELPWKDYSAEQLATSKESGKVVLLEFTADWCLTCKLNLARAIDVRSVKNVVEANGVHAIKVDYTDKNKQIKQLIREHRSRSIPLLAVYPADRPDEVIVLRDTLSKKQVLQALAAAGATESNPERGFELEQPANPKLIAGK